MAGNLRLVRPNVWQATISNGTDANGERSRIYKTIKAKSELAAEKILAGLVTDISRNTFVEPSKTSFGDFCDQWLKEHAEPELEIKTLARYKELLIRIKESLGKYKLQQLRAENITKFYSQLREPGVRLDGKAGGLSERTIHHYHTLLCTILNYAIALEKIHKNPLTKKIAPKPPKKEAKYFNMQQIDDMLTALENQPIKIKTIILLTFYTQIREGELTALEWQDWEDDILYIRRAYQCVNGQKITKLPKNDSSIRPISLPQVVIDTLKEYKVWQDSEKERLSNKWKESGRIFTTWDGQCMHPDTPCKILRKFLAANNMPHIPFHGLRHSGATALIKIGVSLAEISPRLGHARKSTTADTYLHEFMQANKQVADKLGDRFKK
jgi:integrase